MRILSGLLLAAALSGAAQAAPNPRTDAVLALKGDPVRGQALYERSCANCHHNRREWTYVLWLYGPRRFVSVTIDGSHGGKMPSYASWSNQQLADLHAYVASLK